MNVFSGKSVLSAGEPTGKKETIGKLLNPLTKEEVGSIRCIGLNVSVCCAKLVTGGGAEIIL